MADDLNEMLQVGDQQVSLAQLAGMDMEQVEEYVLEFPKTPTGIYLLQAKEGELVAIGGKACMKYTSTIHHVQDLVDKEVNPQDWIGKTHDELMFIGVSPITTPLQDIGIGKKFMRDTGFKGTGDLGTMLKSWGQSGVYYVAKIVKKPNKNDPDKEYSNIDKEKVKPYEAASAPTAPPAETQQAPAQEQPTPPPPQPTAPAQPSQPTAPATGGFRL